MTNPQRVVSSRLSWLITIVLSLTGALAHATTCDVDADGDIDRNDYLAILADIGERASGPNDPRDADRNGRILINDAQLCARRCTLPLCDILTNKAPIAKNDAVPTALDTRVRINVIANDRDRDGRIVPRTARIVTKPKHGKVTRHRDGTVTYSPALGFRGRDRFRYTVKDNRGATSNVAKVTVTVRPGNVPPANVPPVANNDSAATAVNTPVAINVVANDTDANGNLDPTTVAIVANPANGGVVNNGIGTVTYTPNSGFFGTDSFTYNVKDTPQGALSNTATVTVGVNAAPTADAGPDANAVTDQPVTPDGSGSSDPNGDMITFSWRFLSVPPTSGLMDSDIVNPTSPAPSFTPDEDGAYELELTVTDPGGLSDIDIVVITAATPNVAPNADAGLDQNAEVLTLVNLDGSGSSDPDNGPVTPLTFQWSFVSVPLGSGIDETDLQPDANSTEPSFTPDVIGLYRLTLTVSDGDLTDTDDVDITVALPNVPPNADAGSDIVVQLGPPAETATLDGSGSNDPDNGPVTPLTFQWTFASVAPGSTLTNASIQNANTDTASFTPDTAGMYTLQLRVFDGLDESFNEVMVTANAAPVAVNDTYTTDEDTPLNEAAPGVLTNDTDANNDTLTAVLDSGPSNASAFNLNLDGSFTYTPNDNFTGDDTFTYHANDGSADSSVATVTITVNPANDAPVAVNDTYTTNEDGGALAGTSVLASDTDEENDTLTAVLDTDVTNGTLVFNTDGTFSYTPNADFFGTDTFTYHANDGNSDSNVATATITVNDVNDTPSFTAGGNQIVLEDAGPQSIGWASSISAGATNESGQTLTFLVSSNNSALFSAQPAVAANGVLTFTPASNANGSAIVTVTLQDNGGTANGGVDTSSPAQTFTITVTAVNDAPVATAKSHQTHSGIRVTIGASDTGKLKDGATDVDDPFGDLAVNATFTSITPAGATIVLSDAATGTFTYNPPAGFSGAASSQFQVCDDGAPTPPVTCSAPTTVSFTVTGPDLWFVDDSAGAGGSGRLADPFDALSDLPATRSTGDRIFVFTGTYGTGHTLFTNEHLIGQGSSGSFDGVLGVTVPANGTLDSRPALGGARPQLNGTVTVAGGSTVRGLNINSSTVTGLSGGAVAGVSVSEASVTSTTGTAVILNGTGGTVGLTAVSANGAVNGILLNNTTGSFTVTGTGTAGSGGTIQSTSGPGILLSNAAGVSLARMNIQNGGDDGIRGTTVTGFALADSTLQNNGNAIGAFNAGDNGLDFTDLLGTASISSSTITGSFHNNIIIRNSTGTLSGLTVTGANISNNVSTTDGDGFLFEAGGTANMSVNVSGSTFSAHQGDHFQAAALNSGVLNVIFSGNTLSGGHAAPLGQGITINASTGVPGYLGSVSYDLAGNTINGAISNAIFVGLGTSAATASMIGKIQNNTIGTSGAALSCSTQANGVSVDARGNGTFTSAVTGNIIRQCFDRGILSEAGDGDSVLNLTVTGNTIDQQVGALAREAIQTNHGITSTNVFGNVDTNAVCLQLGGAGALANTFSHGLGAPDDFRLRKRFEATVRLPGYAGGTDQTAGSLAQVVTFIQGQNTGSAGEPGSASASGAGGGYTGGAACPLPP